MKNIIPRAEEEKDEFVFRVKREEAAEFFAALFESPYTGAGKFSGQFDLNLNSVQNTILLVMQRIEEQHRSVLIKFSADLEFTNGTVDVKLDKEKFFRYVDIQNRYCCGIGVKIVYLVYFGEDGPPSKQEIFLYFITEEFHKRHSGREVQYEMLGNILIKKEQDNCAYLGYMITYTHRSFGSDLESLITRQCEAAILPQLKNKYRDLIRLVVFVVASIFVFGVTFYTIPHLGAWVFGKFDQSASLVEVMSSGAATTFNVASLFIVLFSVIISASVSRSFLSEFFQTRPSFLRTSQDQTLMYEKILLKYRRRYWLSMTAIIGMLISGLASEMLSNFVIGLFE